MSNYCKKSPCENCPYRKDAPLQLWAKEEFEGLLASEQLDYTSGNFGKIYGCHKQDGHVCVGWLIKQDENNFPSIQLRMSLSKNKVTREYLDSLHCKSELYKSVDEMINANYPEIL
jgi:hypothetical protein